MKTAAVAIAALGIAVGSARAGEYLQTLKEDCWVCSTPEAYDRVVAEQRQPNSNLEELKERYLAQKLCIYADAGFVERIMIPFTKVLERQGSKVKVMFLVQYHKRLEYLHRHISRVQFVGWTEASNLQDREIL